MRDKTNAGRIATVPKGAYDNDTIYEYLDVVEYEGSSYVLKVENSQGNLPTDVEFWQLLAEKGEKGDKGDKGDKPIKGTDYFTDIEKEEFTEKITEYSKEEIKQVTEQGIADFNTNADEIKKDLDRANKKIEELAENMEMKELEGLSIDVSDAHKYSGNRLDIEGRQEQETTKGINMIKIDGFETYTSFGITATKKEDGSIVVNGTATDNFILNILVGTSGGTKELLLEAGAYILSGCPEGGSSNTYKLDMSTSNYSIVYADTGNKALFNLSTNVTFVRVRIAILSGTTVNNLVFKPMLIKGTEPQPFEKYTGGQASPNPDFPQEVKTVKAENLFDINKATKGKAINASGQEVNLDTFMISEYIEMEGNQNGVLSFIADLTNQTNRVHFYDKNKNWLSQSSVVNFLGKTNLFFKTPNDCKFIRVSMGKTFSEIMLKKGIKSNTFIPYGKIGTRRIRKNMLFDNSNHFPTSVGSLQVTFDDEKGTIAIKGASETIKWGAKNVQGNVFNLEEGTYSLYGKIEGTLISGFIATIGLLDSTGATIKTVRVPMTATEKELCSPLTLTKEEVSKIQTTRFIFEGIEPTANNDFTLKLMLLKGSHTISSVGDFEPYKEENHYLSIQEEMLEGDYFTDEEEVHVWNKKILDGTETITKSGTNVEDTQLFIVQGFNNITIDGKKVYSNYFNWNIRIWVDDVEGIRDCSQYTEGSVWIRIKIDRLNSNTVADFKAFLKQKYDEGNPIVVYYQLKEPRKLPLTTEQKAEIKTLKHNFALDKGANHIFSLNEFEPKMKLKYLVDSNARIKSIEDRLALLEE